MNEKDHIEATKIESSEELPLEKNLGEIKPDKQTDNKDSTPYHRIPKENNEIDEEEYFRLLQSMRRVS